MDSIVTALTPPGKIFDLGARPPGDRSLPIMAHNCGLKMVSPFSFGCVVIEMCTGSRPWHDLENNYQIMFKVGMGAKPAVPENASPELEDFLDHCFQFDSKDRWTADQLLDHSFTKVYTEAD